MPKTSIAHWISWRRGYRSADSSAAERWQILGGLGNRAPVRQRAEQLVVVVEVFEFENAQVVADPGDRHAEHLDQSTGGLVALVFALVATPVPPAEGDRGRSGQHLEHLPEEAARQGGVEDVVRGLEGLL